MSLLSLLGGMAPETFFRDFWQKRPLIVRRALADVIGTPVPRDVLFELASRDEVESRLVEWRQEKWYLTHGPFPLSRFKRLPKKNWTLLIQNANHYLQNIDDILWKFNFIPAARLDDLMISVSPPGGTVGPHVDSYDVFLLQVGGAKQWQISAQQDLSCLTDAPLKILRHFTPEQTLVLEHGDMLYLPPQYAHYGVALEAGMTYSVGFRAPSAQELSFQFLNYLQDHLTVLGRYEDPDLCFQEDPARISNAMIDKVATLLEQVRWDKYALVDFLGRYLTEPKPHVFFTPPAKPFDSCNFTTRAKKQGIVLESRTQILYFDNVFYCNGDILETNLVDLPSWQHLANRRRIEGDVITKSMLPLLYEGYVAGYWYCG